MTSLFRSFTAQCQIYFINTSVYKIIGKKEVLLYSKGPAYHYITAKNTKTY